MAHKAFARIARSQTKRRARKRNQQDTLHPAVQPSDHTAVGPHLSFAPATPTSSLRSGHLGGDIGPADVLYLQRMVGNQAVQRILARQAVATVAAPDTATTADGPLSAAQVRSAIRYYTSQPWLYTRDIIMQIQTEMGTTATGHMGPVDVQAVARRQETLNHPDDPDNKEPKLKIDGKAGPRTLPSIFKFGLSKDKSIADYTGKAHGMWDKKNGKTEEETALAIVDDLINKRLAALKIPPIGRKIVSIGSRGAFSSSDWELKLDPLQFQPGRLHDLRDTTATIYHEARHAEQNFRIGQMLARKGFKAAQIKAKTGLREDIAEQAVATRKTMTPMQAVIAQHWFDSLFSDQGLKRRGRNSDKLKATFKAREAACKVFKANKTAENKAKLEKAKAAFSKAVEEHDDLPHEFDAERLEAKVRELYGEGEKHPDDVCR